MLTTKVRTTYEVLIPALKGAQWVKVMTFNVWIPWVRSPVREFFDTARDTIVPVKMIVGTDHPLKCKARVKELVGKYPNVEVKVVREFHAKGILLSNGVGMIGSMNVSDSSFTELAMVGLLHSQDVVEFNDIFDRLWEDNE
jgi:hypothetical protein